MLESKVRAAKRSWSGAVVGLFLIVAGLAGSYLTTGHMVYGYLSSSNWVATPASLRRMEFVKNLKAFSSDGATTYKLEGAYTYRFGGAEYRSTRFSNVPGSDNIGDYWSALYHRIAAAHNNNTVVAYVNPANPAQSLLDRVLRPWLLLFGLILLLLFGGIGVGMVRSSLNAGQRRRRASRCRNPMLKHGDHIIDIVGGVKMSAALIALCLVFGTFLGAIGFLSIKGQWLPGYLFLAAGLSVAGIPVAAFGRRRDIRFVKESKTLHVRTTWFRLLSYSSHGEVDNARQFSIKHIHTVRRSSKVIEYYVLHFHTQDKTLRISGVISGGRAADNLRKQVVWQFVEGGRVTIAA